MGAKQAIKELDEKNQEFDLTVYGINIILPFEQKLNPHVDKGTSHNIFGSRLQEFIDVSWGAYVSLGGIGTALELFYAIQSLQVEHLKNYTLFAHSGWKPIFETFYKTAYQDRIQNGLSPFISEEDINIVKFSHDPDEIVEGLVGQVDEWSRIFKTESLQTKQDTPLSIFPVL